MRQFNANIVTRLEDDILELLRRQWVCSLALDDEAAILSQLAARARQRAAIAYWRHLRQRQAQQKDDNDAT